MSLPDCGTAFERVRQGAGDVDLAGQNGAVASAPLGEAGRTSTTGSALHSAGGIGGLLAVYDTRGTPGTTDDFHYAFAYDGNGNVVQVLDWSASSATAAIVAKYEYDPYGNVVAQAGDYAERNPFRFSTKQWDDETGFGYWEQRYYSPGLGPWINRDPIGGRGGLNLYRYVEGDPLHRIDPNGRESRRAGGPSSKPSQPIDLCKLLGEKNCDGRDIPPGPVEIPVNLRTLLKLGTSCGHIAFRLISCNANLKWEDLALAGGKPCDRIRLDPCGILSEYANGARLDFPCTKGDRVTPDPEKECCCKAQFNGYYAVHIPVSVTIPVAGDSKGKNSGFCSVTGSVHLSLAGKGEVGQCQKTK